MNTTKKVGLKKGKKVIFKAQGTVLSDMPLFPGYYKVEINGHIFKCNKEFLQNIEKQR